MAESTITKILLRRGSEGDLKLQGDTSGTILGEGEPGFTTNTYRLFIGDGTINHPIPAVDGATLDYNDNGQIGLSSKITGKIKTQNTGDGCGSDAQTGEPHAAIVAEQGGIYAARNIHAGGDMISFCSSDERLKQNIKIIDNPLERLQSIQGVTFDWNVDMQTTYTGPDTGLIAQQVEQIDLPGVVTTRDDGYKAIKYERLVSLLVEGVKQLNNKVIHLEDKLASLSTPADGVQ